MSSTLAQVIGRGLASARPAAGVEGRLYFATDTEIAYRDNGSAWDTIELTGSASEFLTEAEADLLYDAIGTGASEAASAVSAHVAAADPHGDRSYADGLISTHEAAADPHPGYVLESLVDAKGDLFVGTAADTVARLAVGTDEQILSANAAVTGGIEWIDNYTGELRTKVKNQTGSALSKGQVVYINGATGSTPNVTLAIADADLTSSRTFGLVQSNTIADGGTGYVTNFGLLKGITTTGYTLGAPIWLSATTAGAYTNVKPTQPDHAVLLGFTVTAASNGEMFVMVQNGFELDELHNVLIASTPTDGHVLTYEASTGLWKPAAPAGDITGVTAGTALTGGGTSGAVTLNVDLGTGATQAAAGNHTHSATVGLDFVIDGGGSAITTGVKGDVRIPVGMTITGVRLFADQSGSAVIDIWKDSYANFPATVADTITASAKPTLSSATKYEDTTLTGWTTSLSAGDVLRFNVDSASTITRLTVSLTLTRSI